MTVAQAFAQQEFFPISPGGVSREERVEEFFAWFLDLPDDEQQSLLKDRLSFDDFEQLRSNRLSAFKDKYSRGTPKKRPEHLPRGFSQAQCEEFIESYNNPYHLAAFLFQLYTFSRICETPTATRFGKDCLRIETPKTARYGRKVKIVPIHGILWELLPVLPWLQERSGNYLRKVFKNQLRKLGPDFNPMYDLAARTKKHPLGRPLYQFSSNAARATATDWCGDARVDPYVIAMLRNDDPKKFVGEQATYRSFKPELARPVLDDVFFALNDYLKRRGLLLHLPRKDT